MSNKRFWASIFAVWAVMMFSDWLFHGMWMQTLYAQTAQYWRPMEEMKNMMWSMWLGRVIFAWAFVWIYSKGISGDNKWHQAFRYALAVWLLSEVPHQMGAWAVSPYPMDLIWRWAFIGGVQSMLAAFVLTWTYNPLAAMQHGKAGARY